MTDTWILYQTTNLVNGKIYVGVHKLADTSVSKHYLGSGKALKTAIKNHSKKNFTRTTLAEFSSAEDAYLAETDMVTKEFISRQDTYNMKIGGMGGAGLTLTEEHKAKIGAASKGRLHSEESKARMRSAQKGKIISKETIEKMKDTKKKRFLANPEIRERMSAAQRGKKHSAEAKAKVSAAQKGNKHCLGRKLTDEHKAKIGAAGKGRVLSPETKAKIGAGNAGRNGVKNSKSVPTMIDGNYYESARIAAKAQGIEYNTLVYRLKASNPKWSEWYYATEEEISNHQM